MSTRAAPRRSVLASAVFGLLDPIPFGCFVAALIFDIIYVRTADMLWDKGAAWLITFGLLFAVVPRLVNLTQVWITGRRIATRADKARFLAEPLRHRCGDRQRVRAQSRCLRGGSRRRVAVGLHGRTAVHRPHRPGHADRCRECAHEPRLVPQRDRAGIRGGHRRLQRKGITRTRAAVGREPAAAKPRWIS